MATLQATLPSSQFDINSLKIQTEDVQKWILTYFRGFMSPSLPVPLETFAAAAILKMLATISLELDSINQHYLLDIHPAQTLIIAEVALATVKTAIRINSTLATIEVTTAAAALVRDLKRATKICKNAYCAPRVNFAINETPVNIETLDLAEEVVIDEVTPASLDNNSRFALIPSPSFQETFNPMLIVVWSHIMLVTYFNNSKPASPPLPRVNFAVFEIVRTLKPLFKDLYFIKIGFVLDINPMHTLHLVKAALAATVAAINAYAALAIGEVITVMVKLARALRQTEKRYFFTFESAALLEPSIEDCIEDVDLHCSITVSSLITEAENISTPTAGAEEEEVVILTAPTTPTSATAPLPGPAAIRNNNTTSSTTIDHSLENLDLPPPGFSLPNSSNEELYRGVLNVANKAFLTGRAAANLGFHPFATACYRVYADNLELVAGYAVEHGAFLAPWEWAQVQKNLQFIKNTFTAANAAAGAEIGAQPFLQALPPQFTYIHDLHKDSLSWDEAHLEGRVH